MRKLERSKSLNDLSTITYNPALFKTKKSCYQGVVAIDLYCFLQKRYARDPGAGDNSYACYLDFSPVIYKQLVESLPENVALCVFDIPRVQHDYL